MTESASQSLTWPQFAWSVPTFLVADVQQTIDWYVNVLGFQIAGKFPDQLPLAYASLKLGYAELMLLSMSNYVKPKLDPPRPAGYWDAYIRTAGVALYYNALRSKADSSYVTLDLIQRPYGNLEFAVTDPNGYILVFGGQ